MATKTKAQRERIMKRRSTLTETPFRSCMAAALLAIAAWASAPAGAAVISATASATLGESMTPAPGSPYSDGPVSSGSVDILEFHFDGSGNSIGIHTFGAADGSSFGSRSSADGLDAASDGTFTFMDTFTNTTGSASLFDFVFTVIPGEVFVSEFDSSVTPGASDDLSAGYVLDINVGGSDAFDSAVTISNDSSGITQTRTGIDLNTGLPFSPGTTSDNSYMWDEFVGSVSLGLLQPGDSVDIDYTLSTTAEVAVYVAGTFACGGGFDGEGGGELVLTIDEPGFGGCSAIARIGDPLPGQTGGNSFHFAPVPAPAGLGLILLGIAGVGFARRARAF